MNWLAWDPRTYLAALFGAGAGALAYAGLLPEHEAPWLVGLGMGLFAAAAARDRSNVRGWILGAAALWGSALAQAACRPLVPGRSFLGEVAAFHESLTWASLALHVLGALLAGLLGARALRAGAGRRLAGA